MKIKHIFQIVTTMLLTLSILGCKKEKTEQEPSLPVTYANLNGLWQLDTWKGESLPEGTWCYIEFKRRERSFVMHQNLNTMFDRTLDGSFEITEDELGNYVVSGTYNWERGNWNSDYYVTNLTMERMTWTSADTPEDVSVYVKIECLPDDIEQ